MLPLLILAILFVSPVLLMLSNRLGVRYAYAWLYAVLLTAGGWAGMLWAAFQLPQQFELFFWRTETHPLFLKTPLALVLDEFSWPLAMGLAGLALGVLLTEVARDGLKARADWRNLAGVVGLLSLGLAGVAAGNPLTLLLSWGAIDLLELFVLLRRVDGRRESERVVVDFSARTAGSLALMWVMISAAGLDFSPELGLTSSQAGIPLLLAAGLRLGVLPMQVSFLQEPPLQRGLGTMLRLTPAASSVMLLARTASAGGGDGVGTTLFLALTGLAALYGSLNWLAASNELEGRMFWVLGAAAMVFASALRMQPEAGIAWGGVLLLGGGQLSIFSARERPFAAWIVLSLLGISGLPFSPSWEGTLLYAGAFQPLLALFLLAQGVLLAGFVRHALRPGRPLQGVSRGVRAIYLMGMAALPFSHFVIGWRPWLRGESLTGVWWPAAVALAVAAGVGVWLRWGPPVPPVIRMALLRAFSLHWLYRLAWRGYRMLGVLVSFLTALLEGEAGILWAILLLILLLSIVTQGAGG